MQLEDLIGISPEIVALTVVAFGTSLPELVTSVSAARKGDVGIATGNIIGSNIANILLIGFSRFHIYRTNRMCFFKL